MKNPLREKDRPAPAPRPFASHLIRLVLAPALPLVAFTIALVGWVALEQRERVLEEMDATSRALQLAIDRELRLTVELLETLAGTSEVGMALAAGPDGDQEARRPLHTLMREAVARRDGSVASVALVRADGRQLVNSFRALEEPMPSVGGVILPPARAEFDQDFDARTLFQEILQVRDVYVSDLLVSEEAGQPFLVVSVPVRRDGGVAALLIAGIMPDSLNAVLRAQQPGRGYFASVADRFGILAARSQDAEEFVGALAPPEVRAFLKADDGSARIEAVAVDGTEVYGSVRRLREAPFAINYAAPREVVDTPLWNALAWTGLAGALALAVFLVASTRQARRLTGELKLLQRDARTIDERLPPLRQDRVTEVASVRAALREGTARLFDSEERLRLAAEGTEMAVWDYDYATEKLVWVGHYLRMLGIEEATEEPVGSALWLERVHPDDLPAVQAETDAAEREDRMSRAVYRIFRASDGALRWLESFGRHVWRDGRHRFIGVTFDITERRAAEERHNLVLREVDHRAKNALAVVQAIVRLTRADDPRRYAEVVAGRVQALARAHELLARDQWQGADLRILAEQELQPHLQDRRVEITGEPARLSPEAVQPFSMVLHELATNAAKYGALSSPEGRVSLCWRRAPESEAFQIFWEEQGGPSITEPPSHSGFGSRLLDLIVKEQLGGSIAVAWRPEGLACTLDIGPGRIRLIDATERPRHPQARAEPAADAPAGDLSGVRVLVVEDEVLVAAELAEMLVGAGCRIVGPIGTVDKADQILAEAGPLDVAVLDIALGRSTSFPLATELIARGVPIVFVTGYGRLPDEWSERPRIVATLRKPVAPAELRAALLKALPGKAAAE